MISQHDSRCTGCTACMAACPQGAISMTPDDEGFSFPHIDVKLCNGCDICNTVCPIELPRKYPYQDYCYIAINGNEQELMYASSGGIFPMLARTALENDGLVCGCILDEDCVARHVLSSVPATIHLMSKSKYVQSNMGDSLKQTKKALDAGRYVLFTGTPCQVGGLMKFLGKDYDNLVTMDFACHGVPSPLYLKKYVNRIKKEYPQAASLWFREKEGGWLKCPRGVWITSDEHPIYEIDDNSYMEDFIDYNYLRKSCPQCQYCTPQRPSDFTVGDFWSISTRSPYFDNRGVSFMLLNTQKALAWMRANQYAFQTLERIELKNVGQPHFWKPYFKGKKKRGEFFSKLKEEKNA